MYSIVEKFPIVYWMYKEKKDGNQILLLANGALLCRQAKPVCLSMSIQNRVGCYLNSTWLELLS